MRILNIREQDNELVATQSRENFVATVGVVGSQQDLAGGRIPDDCIATFERREGAHRVQSAAQQGNTVVGI